MFKKVAMFALGVCFVQRSASPADLSKLKEVKSERVAIVNFAQAFERSGFHGEIAKFAESNQKSLMESMSAFQAELSKLEAQMNEAASRGFPDGNFDAMFEYASRQQDAKAKQKLNQVVMENKKSTAEFEVQASVSKAKATLQEWLVDFAAENNIGMILDSQIALAILNPNLDKTAAFIEYANTRYNREKASQGLTVVPSKDGGKTILSFAKNDVASTQGKAADAAVTKA